MLVLTLMMIGVIVACEWLGGILFKESAKLFCRHGKIMAGISLVVLGALVPRLGAFKTAESIAATALFQIVLLLVVHYYTGGPIFGTFFLTWVWDVTWFTSLAFLSGTIISYILSRVVRRRRS